MCKMDGLSNRGKINVKREKRRLIENEIGTIIFMPIFLSISFATLN